ncbi:MAG TPA: CehA/McbA family metallohydrolase [Pirellulales bacterium]|nr:CehA/McbA family metallohydrolase [Pirellulales bacterium]
MLARCGGALLACLPAIALAHPPAIPSTRVDPAEEARIHTPAGFPHEGKPRIYTRDSPARLHVTITDHPRSEPTPCRVNIVGADGNFYEPRDNVLANWSLQREGNRLGKGPFRYYGWFFYTSGSFDVEVPPGKTRVEVWKGFEFQPATRTVQLAPGEKLDLALPLARTAPLAEFGYYSGDTHIHLPRRDSTDDDRALDLMEAEDIQYGYMLSANDGKSYSGHRELQVIAPQRALGPDAVATRGLYKIASGQEYVTSSYGHIGLLLHRRIVLEGLTVEPNRWPLLGLIGRETRKLGGYSFNLHGGYSNEIYIDFAQRATDGVELLQFAEYRGIALEGWYRMLTIGYRFPALGACDYPYCRVLGDCRTYVYSPQRPDPVQWVRRAAAGHSFFTTGPMLLLEVDGHRPGDVIRRGSGESATLRAHVRVRSEVAPATEVELIVNGRRVARRQVPTDQDGKWFDFDHQIDAREPLWIAARTWSPSASGQPDGEAHTNPVYVTIDDRLPYSEADLNWLVSRTDELITELDRRTFEEKPAALEFYRASKAALLEVREHHGQRLTDQGQETK